MDTTVHPTTITVPPRQAGPDRLPDWTWDLQLHKSLRHAAGDFQLDLACQSNARRLALFGPSGAGKTLSLQLIAGLTVPDRGHARLDGKTLHDVKAGISLPPQARRLAYMFQDYALFPHLTVRQNIAFGTRRGWRNPPPTGVDPATERWLETFGLQGHARHFPHQLSGGQKQRVALARALVCEPAALLLDEPFAALDKALRQHLREQLCELQRTLNIPMLLITHDEDDLEQLADELVHLEAGQVVRHGARAALLAKLG